MGTTVQSITGAGRLPLADNSIGQASSNNAYYGNQRPGNWQQPQHSIESPEGVFSPPNQNGGQAFNQNQAHSSYEAQQAAAAAAHQQQQRGVSQLTSAVASTLGHPPRNVQTPTPGQQQSINSGSAQPGLEKRGPVEFNHAISYVNKIKVNINCHCSRLLIASYCLLTAAIMLTESLNRTASKTDLKSINNF